MKAQATVASNLPSNGTSPYKIKGLSPQRVVGSELSGCITVFRQNYMIIDVILYLEPRTLTKDCKYSPKAPNQRLFAEKVLEFYIKYFPSA